MNNAMEEIANKPKQQRLRKHTREPDKLRPHKFTHNSFAILRLLNDYRFLTTSMLLKLMPCSERRTYEHLQLLYHDGLIQRFAFYNFRFPGENIHYLDNPRALDMYAAATGAPPEELDYATVRYNREREYFKLTDPKFAIRMIGQMRFVQHELMVSRFHTCLDLACRKSNGQSILQDWRQGGALRNKVRVPKMTKDENGKYYEAEKEESLPHEPDAFFTLLFPAREQDAELSFFYEADRGTMNSEDMIRKFRSHFHYVVKQRRHVEEYGVPSIRAVLIEAHKAKHPEKMDRASELRRLAADPRVSGQKPSRFFLITPSAYLITKEQPDEFADKPQKPLPYFLSRPEIILQEKIWAPPAGIDIKHSLLYAGSRHGIHI
jgi:hypothetical protein